MQIRTMRTRYFVIHLDIVTVETLTVRVTLTNMVKEPKVRNFAVQTVCLETIPLSSYTPNSGQATSSSALPPPGAAGVPHSGNCNQAGCSTDTEDASST